MSRLPLDRWKPQEPPQDFLERVDRALDAEAPAPPAAPRGLQRRGLLAALSAGALVAAGGALWVNVRLTRAALQGTFLARVRTEIELVRGVVAVAEPGARLAVEQGWIRQLEGEVAYRSAPDTVLRVITPDGQAEGLGACCRVHVLAAAPRGTGAPGPATALAVLQGEVDLRVARRSERLAAGRYALYYGESIRTDADDEGGEVARVLGVPAARRPSAPVSPPAPASAPSGEVAPAPPVRPRRPAASASVSATPSASAPAPASASARPFIVPRCICLPNDLLCACPE
ncbi:MAG: hypothetical protein MUF64_22220 [Polyangiaceae bacterium]|jgi:hypothetical protein|nr:hypothetical protein [Polyangiaceae bacterium]